MTELASSLSSPPSITNRLSLTRGASAPSFSSIVASPSPSGSPVSPVFSPSSPHSPSPSSTLLSPEEELIRKTNDRLNKRTKLIAEIHETEKAYTSAISRLVSDYLTPLRHACADYNLKYDHIATIFSNIEQIAGFHSILLTQLPKNATATEVCQAFLKFADFLRMYIPYVNNYSDAIKTLTLVNENKKFYRFCQEKKQSMGLDLMSYLIMPVQRIPRYELLLKELKRNLDPPSDSSKPSHESLLLEEALSKIVAVAHQVNEQKRQAERVSALLAIQSRVSHLDAVFPHNTFNAEHRRLIKEGDLYKRSTFSKKQRHCYLFNDIFLWCNNNRYKGHVSIVDLKVQGYNEENNNNSKDDTSSSGSNSSNGGSSVGDKEGGCGMELIHPAIKTMLLYAETVYERNSWLNAFNEAAEEVKTLDPSIIASLTLSNNRQQHERTVSVSSNGATKLTAFNQSDVNSPITPLSPRSSSNIMEEEGEEEETQNTSHTRTHTNTDPAITPPTTTEKAKEEEKDAADASSAQITNSSNSSNTQEEKEAPATASVPVLPSVVVEKKSPRGLSSTAHSRNISRVLDIKPTHQRTFTHSSAANNNAVGSSSSSSTQSTVSTPSHGKSTLSARSRTHSRKVSVVVTGVNSTTTVLSSAANSKQKQQQPPPLPTTAPNPHNHTEANTHAPSKSNHKPSAEEEPDEQSTVISLPTLKLKSLNIGSSSSSSIPVLRVAAASSPSPSPSPSPSAPPSSSIASLSRNDITSLKKMKSPPLPVKLAIESLAVLLDLPAGEPLRGEKKPNYWLVVQTLLVRPNFVKVLLDFEHDEHKVSAEGIEKLREYVNDQRLAPELVQVCSPTAAVLWRWVRERFVAQTGETLTVEDGSKSVSRRVSTNQVAAKVDSGTAGRSAAAHSRTVSVASTPRGVRPAAPYSNNDNLESGSATTKSIVVHSRQHSLPNAPSQPMQHTVAKEANYATGITVTKTRITPTPIPTKPAKPAASPSPSTTRVLASNRSHIGATKKKIPVFGQVPSYALQRILAYCESTPHRPSATVLVNHHWLSTGLSRLTQHNQQAVVSLKAAYAQSLEQLKKEGVSSEEGHRLLTTVDTHNTQLIAAVGQIQPNSLKSLKVLVKPPPAVVPVFKAILLLLESSTAHKTQQQSQQLKNKETVVSTTGAASRDLTMMAHKTVLNHPHLLSWLVTMNASGLYHGLDSHGRSQLVQLIAGCDVAAVEKSSSAAAPFCKWLLCVRACVEWMQQTAHIKTILQLDTQQQQLTDCDKTEMPSKYSQLQSSVQAYLAASAIAHVLVGH